MPKILFVSSYSGLGGGETSTLTLAEHLHGWEPQLFVPRAGAFSQAWTARGWRTHIHAYRGATTYFIPPLWGYLPISHTLTRTLRTEQINLIHSDYHSLPMALPAAQRAGVPLAWTVMGWWFKPHVWQRRFFWQPQVTFAHSRAIVEGFLGTPPFMPPERIQILYPSVDVARFHPRVDGAPVRAALNIGAEVPLVGMVGRFQAVKGHETFVQMAAQVLGRFPSAHFFIAGENLQSAADSAYRARMVARVQEDVRLRARVHFLGHRADMERVLAAADVVVCPSDFESFGVVNVEAMASGKPVVSTNSGGQREVVIEGETGFLVPPKDAHALAERVMRLLNSAELRRSMGNAGRVRALQVFSAQAAAAQFSGALLPFLAEQS